MSYTTFNVAYENLYTFQVVISFDLLFEVDHVCFSFCAEVISAIMIICLPSSLNVIKHTLAQ